MFVICCGNNKTESEGTELAVKKFILKHDIVINSKEYRSVWDSARVHGVVYQGETYADEIEELRKISKEE